MPTKSSGLTSNIKQKKKAALSQRNRAMPRVIYPPPLFHLEFRDDRLGADRRFFAVQ